MPPPVVTIRNNVNPDVQVSTVSGRTTSLSLQGVDHFDSFRATGGLPAFNVGVFLRF